MIRFLFLAGMVLMGFDVTQLHITGVFLLGVVCWLISAYITGVFTRVFWDSETLHPDDSRGWSDDDAAMIAKHHLE